MGTTTGGVVLAPCAPAGMNGRIRVPPSKSLTQRALVAAALAGSGASVIDPLDAEDPRLLYEGLCAAGFDLHWREGMIVAGERRPVTSAEVTMGNNGTGVRLLLAQLAALPGRWRLDGTTRLRERPIASLVESLRALGAVIEPLDAGAVAARLPLRVEGRELAGGEVGLDASASSQFVSALLLLGCRLPAGLKVQLAAAPPSRPYIDLTTEVLRAFGVNVEAAAGGLRFAVASQPLQPCAFSVEGDWSAAAFPLAAVAIAGGEVEIEAVRADSHQGDAVVLRLLLAAGCATQPSLRGIVVRGPATRPVLADLADAPDLFPALSVVVARVGGRLDGLAALKAKESDRLATMAAHLRALGADVSSGDDWFAAAGGLPARAPDLPPLDPAADHRIAMALAVAGAVVAGVRIANSECVAKSWPTFWQQWPTLTT